MPLRIHFLNVGHGDCTIIEHPSGRITVVDFNRQTTLDERTANELYGFDWLLGGLLGGKEVKDTDLITYATAKYRQLQSLNLTDPLAYYLRHFRYPDGTVRPIWRLVLTHPDLDHIDGLHDLIDQVPICHVWDTSNIKSVTNFTTRNQRLSWNAYTNLTRVQSFIPVLRLYRGSEGTMYSKGNPFDNGDSLHILAPTPELSLRANLAKCWNMHSYILWLGHAGRSVILGGDADESCWQDTLSCYGQNLKCDILKASHHGRDSGYHQASVKEMAPKFTIVSVGKKPDTDATQKYRQYTTDSVLSTRFCGNIVVTIDDWGNIFTSRERVEESQGILSLLGALQRK